ncbi:MAG: phosphatidylinositol-specific phospholipase C domain-containing protein [Ilumatobacteraceae bacterium]|jgi:hypothetical protein
MRTTLSWMFLVVGAVLLVLSIPAGYLNRTVLDAPTFASKVDELRQRDDVSDVLGREVSAEIISLNPDLVAIEPLVEQVAIGVVGSDALSGPVRLAASQFNQALTTENSDQLVLRILDVGAVVTSLIGAVAPDQAPEFSDIGLTLANLGGQGFATDIIGFANYVDTLAWLLPLLTIALFAAAVLVHPDRWTAIRRVGWSAIIAIGVLAVVAVLSGAAVRAIGGDERTDAIVNGVWDLFVAPIWWSLGLVAGLGALLVMVGSGRAAEWDLVGIVRHAAETPTTPRWVVAKALASIAAGVALIVEPAGMVTLLAFVAGIVLVVAGVGALARLGAASRAATATDDGGSWGPLAIAALIGVVALVGAVVWAARPPDSTIAGAVGDAVAGDGEVCNGHEELCDRTFDEVSYAATHNSMSVAGRPGWFLGEQGLDIVPSLDSGVRALLIDVWYGNDAGSGKVRTAARSYEEALAIANEELGPETVDAALRVINAVAPGEAGGPEALYMCHGLCETGATSFDDTLADIRSWLATNPDEVLTIFVEDHVDAADVAESVLEAGLEDYLFTPVDGEPFPTLAEMIQRGQRLVVMLESGDGRPDHPWLVNGFDFVQETPYDFPTVESFSCAPNRGVPDAPLLQINHWLNGFTNLVSDAQLVNAADVLGTRVEQCREERGMQPNLVAVNHADIGDLMAVVDRLNGVD